MFRKDNEVVYFAHAAPGRSRLLHRLGRTSRHCRPLAPRAPRTPQPRAAASRRGSCGFREPRPGVRGREDQPSPRLASVAECAGTRPRPLGPSCAPPSLRPAPRPRPTTRRRTGVGSRRPSSHAAPAGRRPRPGSRTPRLPARTHLPRDPPLGTSRRADMRPAKPGALLPLLLLLALALSLPGAQARPQGRGGARATDQEPQPWPFLPAARATRSTEMFLKDSSLKDKIIRHFTGPVTFADECSIHFHRLYYNTRDCSTPAYYKRCARLLTRLAASPQCSQTRPGLGALLKNINAT
ncbi:ALK and LTK ligand 1 [Panthera tigris]|uniref:ALK and LTK ligand 1 n=1 Tax=Panthera tigris TaxID=9694 RepID=UPI001C6F8E92|nr:ALK and LTK ligand 1 [Panthera tigris]